MVPVDDGPPPPTPTPTAAPSPTPEVDRTVEQVPPLLQVFDEPHGLRYEPFLLTLAQPLAAGELRYTLDGRSPGGETSLPYVEPLWIDDTTVLRAGVVDGGELVLDAGVRTWIFPEHIPEQEAPPDWPTAWWPSEDGGPYGADYGMDPDVVGAPATAESFPSVFEAVPSISLVLDPDDLFDPVRGIHEQPLQTGPAWERWTSVEVLAPDGGVSALAGLRIQGGAGRRPDRSSKKSFRLAFRSDYSGDLDYPLFEEGEVATFDTLVLRAGYNRSWNHFEESGRTRSLYMRESFGGRTHAAMGHTAVRGRPVHLFLDGIYWGLYLIEERPDAAFLASTVGGERADWDVVNSGEVTNGEGAGWERLHVLAGADLSVAANRDALAGELDVEAFADYMLLNHYLGNLDWPHKNYYAARLRSAEGRWRFLSWDTELIQSSVDDDVLDVAPEGSPGSLFAALRGDPEFRLLYADRAHHHLLDEGALTPSANLARWESVAEGVVPAVIAESARWGDHWRDVRGTGLALYTWQEHWQAEHARMVDEWFPHRTGAFVDQLRAADLYPAVEAASVEPPSGAVEAGDAVGISAPAGVAWCTLDGTDPRTPLSGSVAAGATDCTDGLILDGGAELRVRVLDGETWSPLVRRGYVGP